jgi:hypothetical protein
MDALWHTHPNVRSMALPQAKVRLNTPLLSKLNLADGRFLRGQNRPHVSMSYATWGDVPKHL